MTDDGAWNGLGVGLGNVWRLADAETRSISPENFTGEKGRGGMATEGTGAGPGRDLGPGMEDLAIGDGRAGRRRSCSPTSRARERSSTSG